MKRIIMAADLHHDRNDQMNRVYSPEGIAPTLKTVTGGGREVKILVKTNTKKGYEEAHEGDSISLDFMKNIRRERVGKMVSQTLLSKGSMGVVVPSGISNVRKMTPKEYFRVMGFDDADVDLLVRNGISNSQLYKMAGNSIVVNMLEFLFCQIFDTDDEIWV